MNDKTNETINENPENLSSRREFLRTSAAAGMGAALAGIFLGASPALASPLQQTSFGPKRKLIWVPFRFDTGGSQIIFYSPEQDYAELDHARTQGSIPSFRESQESTVL